MASGGAQNRSASLTWLGGVEQAEAAAEAAVKQDAVEKGGPCHTNGVGTGGGQPVDGVAEAEGGEDKLEEEGEEEDEEKGLEAFGDAAGDEGEEGLDGAAAWEDWERAIEGSPLSNLQGFWVDCKHPKKGYMIQGKWCSVWRKGWQSNQHHKLYVVGEDVYWGLQHNFFMQWKDDDTITWYTTNDNVEKFSWYRSEGPPTAYDYADQLESGKGRTNRKSGYAKGKYLEYGTAGFGTKHVACKFFMRGPERCINGDRCYFSHDPTVISTARLDNDSWWWGNTWGSHSWASDDSGWFERSWSASRSKGSKSNGTGKSEGRSAWKGGWESDWWSQDAGAGTTESMSKDERWLLESVCTMIQGAPDGLNVSFLGTKFATNFQHCVRPGETRSEGAFKAWLASTGRFKFMPDPVHKNLCLVLSK